MNKIRLWYSAEYQTTVIRKIMNDGTDIRLQIPDTDLRFTNHINLLVTLGTSAGIGAYEMEAIGEALSVFNTIQTEL